MVATETSLCHRLIRDGSVMHFTPQADFPWGRVGNPIPTYRAAVFNAQVQKTKNPWLLPVRQPRGRGVTLFAQPHLLFEPFHASAKSDDRRVPGGVHALQRGEILAQVF
jgi:hypothetical protein